MAGRRSFGRAPLGTLVAAVAAVAALGLGACSAPGPAVAVLRPIGTASSDQLSADVAVLNRRLQIMGASDTAAVQGSHIVIRGARLPIPAASLARTGHIYMRPVLCGAPDYTPAATVPADALPACGPSYADNSANLGVSPDSQAAAGYQINNMPPDPTFARYPSTTPTADLPTRSVLLPAAGADAMFPRFVLGPSQMSLDPVTSAEALNQFGQWAVGYSLSPSAAAAWDRVAQEDFHQFLAIDIDGQVVTAPIIEPTQGVFTSFQGKGEIAGNFDAASAKAYSALFGGGPLAVPLDAG